MPRADADALLLTVDRFVAAGATDVTPIEREELLARFGLYGVRTSVRLIRLGGASSATELAAELRAVSGIEDLRQLLATLFTERRDVLEGARRPGRVGDRAARRTATPVVCWPSTNGSSPRPTSSPSCRSSPPSAAAGCRCRPPRSRRSSGCSISPAPAPPNVSASTDGDERAAVLAAVDRWRRRSEHPMSSRAVVETSTAVVRTLEGLLQQLGAR